MVCQLVEPEVRTLLYSTGPKTGRSELPSHAAVIFEHLLSAIAVMNIEINNQDFGRQTSSGSVRTKTGDFPLKVAHMRTHPRVAAAKLISDLRCRRNAWKRLEVPCGPSSHRNMVSLMINGKHLQCSRKYGHMELTGMKHPFKKYISKAVVYRSTNQITCCGKPLIPMYPPVT